MSSATEHVNDHESHAHLHPFLWLGGRSMEWTAHNTPDNFFLEILKIRNKAIYMLMAKHGLNLGQVIELRLSDVDLKEKWVAVKQMNKSNPAYLTMTADTADALIKYLRVRSPSKENKLFLVEHTSERGTALNCTFGQQLFF